MSLILRENTLGKGRDGDKLYMCRIWGWAGQPEGTVRPRGHRTAENQYCTPLLSTNFLTAVGWGWRAKHLEMEG